MSDDIIIKLKKMPPTPLCMAIGCVAEPINRDTNNLMCRHHWANVPLAQGRRLLLARDAYELLMARWDAVYEVGIREERIKPTKPFMPDAIQAQQTESPVHGDAGSQQESSL